MGVEFNSLNSLVDYALKAGATISVWDGEEWGVKKSTDRHSILSLVNDLDEALLRFRSSNGEILGTAQIVNGLAPDELVADYTCTPFMDAWERQGEGVVLALAEASSL